ncbi:MAG TPA: aldo/keto reductase [Hyphomicrobiaceae bacterium]|jgi:aryl-alcohol dehydrogenase-like predicted oxidoreductase|nr:aldo/keto reductase [Hyphomicrobiaceae bacterium]
MHYTTLGKTQLRVSVAGLGCGGNSRIGLGSGLSEAQCVALVQEALDLGVNLLDTAAAYGTETIVGKAIKGRARDGIVISTKSHVSADGNPLSGAQVVANLDTSLRRLDSEYVDIFHLHGLSPKAYGHAMTEIVPALLRQKEKGKLRHLAVSETGPRDPEHKMLERAAEEGVWEVVMLAFHMLHQNARQPVLERTRANGIGTLCMFAVRNIFSKPGLLQTTVRELIAQGQLEEGAVDAANPLGFLLHASGAENVIDAAYRFARHEPGIDVVLFGTGSAAHLRSNIASILRPPLPAPDVARLKRLFGHLVGVGLDLPDRIREQEAKR